MQCRKVKLFESINKHSQFSTSITLPTGCSSATISLTLVIKRSSLLIIELEYSLSGLSHGFRHLTIMGGLSIDAAQQSRYKTIVAQPLIQFPIAHKLNEVIVRLSFRRISEFQRILQLFVCSFKNTINLRYNIGKPKRYLLEKKTANSIKDVLNSRDIQIECLCR